MQRIYHPTPLQPGASVELSAVHYHHLIHVLRKKEGESLRLISGDNLEWDARIISINRKSVLVSIGEATYINRESPFSIHLAHSLCKGDKFDLIVQKAVELGVAEITPLVSSRSAFASLEQQRIDKKTQHWQGVMISAIEQCGRNHLPRLNPVCDFKTFIQHSFPLDGIKCILTPGTSYSLSDVSKERQSAVVLIGPEGGWSESEIQFAQEQGYQPMTLGPRVLRTETASLVILSILQAMFGDM